MENIKNGKVRRMHSACCGMENGKIYDARIGFEYVSVLLPDGSWTSDHWAAFHQEKPFFEIIKEQ